MKATESTTQQHVNPFLLLLRTSLKYIVICVSLLSTTLSYADEGHHSRGEGWAIGAGLSLLKSEEASYRYLQSEISRVFESGILLGGEAAVSIDENKEKDVDGSIFLSDYFGLSAGYQHRISETFSGTLKVLVGFGVTEEVHIDGDSHGTCDCRAIIVMPAVSLDAQLSQKVWLSLDVRNVTIEQNSSPWAGLILKHKF